MRELERCIAKMFCVGFSGTTMPQATADLMRRGIRSAILFSRNIQSAEQCAALCADLKSRTSQPFLIAIDQEGGRVQRLRAPFSEVPPMRAVGELGDVDVAREVGRLLARELRAVNVDMDFAPVLDVDTNPSNPVIGDRSFGPTPEVVSRMGCAVIEGLQAEGVAACGKHFPGHGDTSQDSHVDLPRLPHSLERLQRVELPPFWAAVRSGVAAIMTAHVIFEPLDRRYPATMSRPALDGILRDQMHFDGVVVSDDLEMKAVADHFGLEEAVMRGTNAGVDLFLVCHHAEVQHQAIDHLIRAVERGEVSRDRIEQANRRIDFMIGRFAQPAHGGPLSGVIGCDEHRAVISRLRGTGAAPTVVQSDPTERR